MSSESSLYMVTYDTVFVSERIILSQGGRVHFYVEKDFCTISDNNGTTLLGGIKFKVVITILYDVTSKWLYVTSQSRRVTGTAQNHGMYKQMMLFI